MRKLAIFVIAVSMVLGGGLILFELATVAVRIWGWMVFGGVFLIVAGLGLLWEDFFRPNTLEGAKEEYVAQLRKLDTETLQAELTSLRNIVASLWAESRRAG